MTRPAALSLKTAVISALVPILLYGGIGLFDTNPALSNRVTVAAYFLLWLLPLVWCGTVVRALLKDGRRSAWLVAFAPLAALPLILFLSLLACYTYGSCSL